jgi:hypothetical protein
MAEVVYDDEFSWGSSFAGIVIGSLLHRGKVFLEKMQAIPSWNDYADTWMPGHSPPSRVLSVSRLSHGAEWFSLLNAQV